MHDTELIRPSDDYCGQGLAWTLPARLMPACSKTERALAAEIKNEALDNQ
jgi:hypothetical protein